MVNSLIIFDEPDLEFRYEQRLIDPRDGLALFGPYDADMPSQPGTLTYTIIGTSEGIAKFSSWAGRMNSPTVEDINRNHLLWPPFPGFEATFNSKWPEKPVWLSAINRNALIEKSRLRDPHERAYNVVDCYLEGLKRLKKSDEKIGVVICVVPDEVWLNCRPKSHVVNPVGAVISVSNKKARRAGQMDMFDAYDPSMYQLSPDFRRQLKARAMQYGVPLQIIRESTLRLSSDNPMGQRGLTPLSDRMWNMSTALYYKCGGKPWRLVSARDGVCYIGIAFRRAEDATGGTTACCAAQMFLNTGEGVVFLGEYGPWYSPKTKQFHLSKSAAHDLLSGVLKTYRELEGKDLKEIFLHSRSVISAEEFEGYQDACPNDVKLVGVRVRLDSHHPRLYRPGKLPVIRGTMWKLSEQSGFLWASGFKSRLATYDGWEVPIPLRIDILYGDATIERVGKDILGLTKLNYNACRLGDAEPVTVGFSDAVGEILISNPTVSQRRPNFKFYI